ncbi:MAG: hypothetical protein AAGI71_18870 [Bacteroidota bacterium]
MSTPRVDSQAPTASNEAEVPAGIVAQLIFAFLRQLSTLSLAAAGGSITLVQTVFSDSELQGVLILGTGLLFLAALVALQTQQVLVERLAATTQTLKPAEVALERFQMARTPKTERVLTYVAFGLFGAGLGTVLMVVITEFLLA